MLDVAGFRPAGQSDERMAERAPSEHVFSYVSDPLNMPTRLVHRVVVLERGAERAADR